MSMNDLLLWQMMGNQGAGGQPQAGPPMSGGDMFPMMSGAGMPVHQGLLQSPLFAAHAYRDTPASAPGGMKTLGGQIMDPALASLPTMGAGQIKQQNMMDKFGSWIDQIPTQDRIMMTMQGLNTLADAFKRY